MIVLVVGEGAREHALVWTLAMQGDVVYCAPGNAGTALHGTNVEIASDDIAGLLRFAYQESIELTVVGPEEPLRLGIVDMFQAVDIPIVGPTAEAAKIETSKIFARELMKEIGVPCAHGESFGRSDEAIHYLRNTPGPWVVKADGLAAGKGVVVTDLREEAEAAVVSMMDKKIFGAAGSLIVIEEKLVGREISVIALVSGSSIVPLVSACDYKRALKGDQGPNTGGMGAFCPSGFLTPDRKKWIMDNVMHPVVARMKELGKPYSGFLYAGLMDDETNGFKVLEFNCRLGDPETQVIIPRLRSKLSHLLMATAKGYLEDRHAWWDDDVRVGVVMTSADYPAPSPVGYAIYGLDDIESDAVVFHGATRVDPGSDVVRTAGGRVLTVVGRGATMAAAHAHAYKNMRCIRFYRAQYRTDIAKVGR